MSESNQSVLFSLPPTFQNKARIENEAELKCLIRSISVPTQKNELSNWIQSHANQNKLTKFKTVQDFAGLMLSLIGNFKMKMRGKKNN